MFIPHLRLVCLTFILSSLIATATFAETYKWVDKNGQINYSQQAPRNITATKIKDPLPPAMDPNAAQQQIDELINQQDSEDQTRLEQQNKNKIEAENEANQETNCNTAQQQLQQYQNNPGRKAIDADSNVTRLTEEERQQKIQELQKNVSKYCQ
tara:strand:+ start:28469 stop:28930 length:462 start_codon:yes stop_codon:yes gene_type:complete